MLVLGSNHRFCSVESHLLRHFSRASNLLSGVVQTTCMVRFSNVFPLRLAFVLGQRVNGRFLVISQDFRRTWTSKLVDYWSSRFLSHQNEERQSISCPNKPWQKILRRSPTHREEPNSFDNKIVNYDISKWIKCPKFWTFEILRSMNTLSPVS